MGSFIRVNKNFSLTQDFWEINPQMRIYPPFNKLYNLPDSSKIMWCIYFMCDPDEDDNKLYRLEESERRRVIEENYHKVDWDDPLVLECLEAYPLECMDSIERSLKAEKDSLVSRSKLIRETEPTLDRTVLMEGKAAVMKGTALQLDTMRSKTAKIYDELETVIKKFQKHKAEEARVYGGRKETASEKGII